MVQGLPLYPDGRKPGRTLMKVRNIFIIFIVSGFWHGSNWTFIAWGFLNALYFLPLLLTGYNRKNTDTVAEGRIFPKPLEFLQVLLTFFLTLIAWIFFRSDTIAKAFDYLGHLFSASLFKLSMKDIWAMNTGKHFIYLSFMILIFILVEWFQRNKQHGFEIEGVKIPKSVKYGIYYLLILACFLMNGIEQQFIYFQF